MAYEWEYEEWRCAVAELTELERAEFEPDDSDRYGWGIFEEQEREVEDDE